MKYVYRATYHHGSKLALSIVLADSHYNAERIAEGPARPSYAQGWPVVVGYECSLKELEERGYTREVYYDEQGAGE